MIQRLTPNDLTDFRALQGLFAEAFEDPEHYLSARPSDGYVRSLLADAKLVALVAKSSDRVVGGLVAYVLQKLEQERSEIYIYDLAVSAGHRRQGIATSLIRQVQTIGTEIGAWVTYVQADYGDEPAIRLYSKLGKREDVMHFDIEVPK